MNIEKSYLIKLIMYIEIVGIMMMTQEIAHYRLSHYRPGGYSIKHRKIKKN
jgi:hypothetical protein